MAGARIDAITGKIIRATTGSLEPVLTMNAWITGPLTERHLRIPYLFVRVLSESCRGGEFYRVRAGISAGKMRPLAPHGVALIAV